MQQIHSKTLQDLEFPTVLEQLAARCNTELGKEAVLKLQPLTDKEYLKTVLGQTSEYLASFENDNRIPNHGFDTINSELKLLTIENTTLEISGFRRIGNICKTIGIHKKFFKKFKEYYPLLFAYSDTVEEQKTIAPEIDAVIDKFGEIRDNASVDLKHIRHQINGVRGKINQSFGAALTRYQASEFLDEIRESVVENRRVLAVKAMHRKKVRGTVMGTSKTGSIAYIVPEATLQYSTELSNLEFEEKEEIQKILNQLTNYIRPFSEALENYQHFLTHIDITASKAKYALEMNAVLPKINEDKQLYLRDAYHCNNKTLFLIDEFGTGSDPELGGALAEACLEVFYEREAYGVITTHYSNLKLLANELPHAVNANMLFDNKTLLPTFKLVMGQAGSSFTFEVAQKNGIPYSLINKAKKKIERGKVRFDATIAKLQKERSKMAKTGSRLQDEETKARGEAKRLEELNAKVKSKLENYQEQYERHRKNKLLMSWSKK